MLPTTQVMLNHVCEYLGIKSSLQVEYALQQVFDHPVFELLDILHLQEYSNPLSDNNISGSSGYNHKLMHIGLCGKIGSGKTTIQNYLCHKYGYINMAFATALKKVVSYMFMIPYDIVSGQDRIGREQILPLHSHYLNKKVSARHLLQIIGTDVFRNYIDEHIWVNKLRNDIIIAQQQGYSIIVEDSRFPNERALLKQLGFNLWYVHRDDLDTMISNVSLHSSENQMEDNYDMVIDNNGSLSQLCDKLDHIIQ